MKEKVNPAKGPSDTDSPHGDAVGSKRGGGEGGREREMMDGKERADGRHKGMIDGSQDKARATGHRRHKGGGWVGAIAASSAQRGKEPNAA